jgi:hypothetical protein
MTRNSDVLWMHPNLGIHSDVTGIAVIGYPNQHHSSIFCNLTTLVTVTLSGTYQNIYSLLAQVCIRALRMFVRAQTGLPSSHSI